MRDLYEIIGVDRNASDDAIKRAYKQKARRLHPDAGGDEDAFKELSTAYEVLKNPDARANYDRFGDPRGPGGPGAGDPFAGFGDLSDLIETFFGGGFGGARGQTQSAPRSGRDALLDVTVTLEEAASGVTRDLDVTVLRACDSCEGSGAAPGTSPVRCETCAGQGSVQQVTRSVFGQMLTSSVCPRCRGTGQQIADPCPKCRGEGRRQVSETITVNIPPGVDTGRRLRLAGRGEAGRLGGPAGDLFVRVRVEPHELFERDGNDLHCQVRIPMVQAVLGIEVDLPTIDGHETLRIPAGTQPGDVMTLRRQGMPKLGGGGARGDLYVHCRVDIPTTLSEEETELLRQFAELRGEDKPGVENEDRGIFHRLRGVFGG